MKKIRLGRSRLESIVDDEDFERVSKYRWYPDFRDNGTIYVKGKVDGRHVRLHRFVLGLAPGTGHVDHQDGDGLNNSRKNLLATTRAHNIRNGRKRRKSRSRYRGVMPLKGEWVARLWLGRFKTEEEAAAAYVKAYQGYFGTTPRHPSQG